MPASPTEIKWNLPPGWKVGEIQWPTPLKLAEPGDIHVYGYHDEVLLMQEITPPASIADWSGQAFRRSELARLREDLHSGQRDTLQLELPVGRISRACERRAVRALPALAAAAVA